MQIFCAVAEKITGYKKGIDGFVDGRSAVCLKSAGDDSVIVEKRIVFPVGWPCSVRRIIPTPELTARRGNITVGLPDVSVFF